MLTQHPPARVIDIDFSQPKKVGSSCRTHPPCKRPCIPPPTFHEKNTFLKQLEEILPNSSILLATVPRQAPTTAPTPSVRRRLPEPLSSLHHPRYGTFQRDELIAECNKEVFTKLKITEDEADYLRQATSLQSECILWYKHREGRITASQFGSVCQTRIEHPSTSLVKSILERQPSPKAAALEWGSKNEAKARKEYIQSVKGNHVGFKVQTTGLHVNPDFTHLGASPDGLVSCSCCGDGLLEVKCPYSKRHHSPADIHDTAFYLKHTTDGLKLSTKHKYYHQVQGQMAVYKCS